MPTTQVCGDDDQFINSQNEIAVELYEVAFNMLNLNRGNAIIKCIKCEVDISSRKKIVPSAKLCVECANDLEHQHKFLKFSKTK